MRTSTRATVVAGTTAVVAALTTLGVGSPAAAVTTTHEPFVFTTDRDGDNEIYRQDADGSRKRVLTHDDARDNAPAWSPDGRSIAFVSDRDGGEPEIYVMRADGRVERRLTVTEPVVMDHTPTWTPDSQRILFSSNRDGFEHVEVFSMKADGTDVRQLTHTGDLSDENAPDVSPDGRRVVFSSNRSGQHELYVMDVDGTDVQLLTGDPGLDDVFPRWTADGQRVVFWTFAAPDGSVGEGVWSVDADGTDRRRLTVGAADEGSPDPRPAG